jgi:branched-chain amino acid transport system ATP-binding protein
MLELRGVDAFYGRAQVLFDVSFELHAGQILVLLGRNGAGKSTTLKSVMGLVRPAAGEVRWDGGRIDGLEPFRIARMGLGYVPEERRVFSDLTVLENLDIGRRPPRHGLPAWTPERLFALFPGLGEMRHRRGGQMSGGEQQMLAIARTLMGNPACVLLDEPSEGLAPIVVDRMSAAVLELKKAGVSVLLSEQNLHFATAVADRACIIEKGRICHAGSVGELQSNEALCRAYLAL